MHYTVTYAHNQRIMNFHNLTKFVHGSTLSQDRL